ncbi:ABC transporter ATP-binding protein [Lysobacter claricitrinus]|uniref:ABC transporter ATP-binding protein n=1 Tax=Lysobacter claricitrinus TaxID=3367728 RepID=UPI0037DAF516
MCSDTVISVERVRKSYLLFPKPHDRLKQFILPRVRKLLGLSARRYYHPFEALQGVSFEVKRGETVGIIGRNGSGKSTLLQILCGTLSPTSGTVRTRGRIAALLELGSGFNPEFSGRENVYLNAAILGLAAREIDAVFDDIVRFADIGDFLDQPIKTYSSGMVVRLAFATAIHVDPDILVVDEALAVGDVAFQQKCLDRIRALQKRGVSILLVTHSTNALIEYCDRGLFLKRGRLVLDGPCRDVVKAYADDLVLDEGGDVAVPELAEADVIESACRDGGACEPIASGGDDKQDAALVVQTITFVDALGNPCSAVMHGTEFKIRLRMLANRDIAYPCFGMQISSVDGISLWSATTQSTGFEVAPIEAGLCEVEWTLRADFGGSRYVVAVGVGEIVNGEYRRSHRVGYAGHFDVLVPPHSGDGWLAPQPSFGRRAIADGVRE